MIFRLLLLATIATVVAACTATGSATGEGAKPSVITQAPSNDQQQRAKNHVELGSLYLLEGRSAIALEEARIALTADPDYAPAFNLLGMTHMGMNEPRLAEENFQKALRIAPGDPEISNNFGWFLCQNGRERQAIEYFMAAAKNPLYNAPSKAYTNAGICAQKLKEEKVAEDYLLTALQHAPANTLAQYWLADIAYRQGRYAVAKQWVSDIERLVEPTAEVLWLAARVERKLGNREGENRYATQLRRRFPGTPEQRLLNQGKFE